MKHRFCLPALVAAACLIATTAGAQQYPNRLIRFVVAFPTGSSTDTVARVVGSKLGESFGQTVVIENRPGAGGNVAAQVVKRANPDGHSVLVTASAFAVNVTLHSNAGYQVSDFVPVLQGPTTPNVITVHPSVKATTLKEVLALSRSTPMSYGSAGTGTTPHLDMEMILSMAKAEITHVPYGPAQAVSAVVGNQVPISSTSLPPAVPHIQAGRVRPIAVTTATRSKILPAVPTVAESGFPGFADHNWFSFFVPAGTPPAIVAKLSGEINRILQMPDVKEKLDSLSLEYTPNTSSQFAAVLKREVEQYAKVIRAAKLQAN